MRVGPAKFSLFVLALLLASGSAALAGDFDFFEKHIRPVLVDRCYQCHSAESEKLKGGLRVDMREGLLKGGESGLAAVVASNPDQSRLIQAIRWTDDDLKMPPKEKLSDEQIAHFVEWIKLGAPDPRGAATPGSRAKTQGAEHWAFKRVPDSVPLPTVKQRRWAKTPIDQFILAKLEEKGLSPSAPADKRTLIRRATFDLTGLPPTPEEVDAFVNDRSRDAYAKLVDRLLASPRYGERWGRYWLDVARYADTKGYVYTDREEARFVHSYAYRDWVIRALNEDMPYDRFILEQLAADQLPGASPAAMGFLTLGRRFLGVVHDIIDDRIDVTGRGLQGLTISCARCHDHKFDPIPTRDYYSLYGVFAGGTEKIVPVHAGQASGSAEFEKGLKERVDKYNQTMQRKRDDFSNRFRAKAAEYLVASLDAKKLPTEEFYEIRGPDDLNPLIVRAWETWILQAQREWHPVFAPWHQLAAIPPADFAAKAPGIIAALKNRGASPERVNPLVLDALAGPPVTSMRDVAERYGKLLAGVHQRWQEQLKSAEAAKSTVPARLESDDDEELRQVLYGSNAPVNVPALAAADLEWYFDEGARVELMKLNSEIERWIIKSNGAPPHAVVLEDKPVQRTPRVFLRGNPATKGDEVRRQFLEVVAGSARQPFETGSGRLELAHAIANSSNPLTARVMVNRVWSWHFGAALVKTPSDFGTRADPPSHPELLDWLARRFMDDGWSLKMLHRIILLSATYQQSSDVGGARGEVRGATSSAIQHPTSRILPPASSIQHRASGIDPENRLLWRMNRQRLDFEALRDSLLFASGELDLEVGGPPVDLFKQPVAKRRTVYGFIDRQFLPGTFRVFDFANPDMHSPQRPDTTVPQQALFFMNSPFVAERARALLARSEVNLASRPEARVRHLYRALFQREPTPQQLRMAVAFVKESEAEPPIEPPVPAKTDWLYGFGEFDEASQRVKTFERLPHFSEGAWQGGEKWPDDKLGWVRLTAEGGHAGNDLAHAAIRRWIAPADATIEIAGSIQHEHKEGDGIRARVVSSRSGVLGAWELHNQKQDVALKAIEVKKGDTVDFVVDIRGGLNSDDFKWAPKIKRTSEPSPERGTNYASEWDAKKEFAGTPPIPPRPLSAWERYAQVLLLSNEFLFVD